MMDFITNMRNLTYFFVKKGNSYIRIIIEDIIFLKSEGNYVRIKTANSEVVTKESLTKCQKKLSNYFLRVHGSYIVNMNRLTSFNLSDEIVKIDEHNVPLGRSFRRNFLDKVELF